MTYFHCQGKCAALCVTVSLRGFLNSNFQTDLLFNYVVILSYAAFTAVPCFFVYQYFKIDVPLFFFETIEGKLVV